MLQFAGFFSGLGCVRTTAGVDPERLPPRQHPVWPEVQPDQVQHHHRGLRHGARPQNTPGRGQDRDWGKGEILYTTEGGDRIEIGEKVRFSIQQREGTG